jgi:hypothetical protein
VKEEHESASVVGMDEGSEETMFAYTTGTKDWDGARRA